jgi:hypothetical protein
MEFEIDRRPSAAPTFRPLEPSHLWVLGLVHDEDRRERPADRIVSYRSECECPGDCLRDHENE